MAPFGNNICSRKEVKGQALNLAEGKENLYLDFYQVSFYVTFKLGHKVMVPDSNAKRPTDILHTCEICC